jgi:hypothetical protein
MIANMPAAVISGMCTCVGPPDVITMGAQTVLIQGLPAARLTSMTAHGGTIVVGAPTVLIGGPSFSVPRAIVVNPDGSITYGNAITIKPDNPTLGQRILGTLAGIFGVPYNDNRNPNFQSEALAALVRLDTTPSGQAMFNDLDASGRNVTIQNYSPNDPYYASMGPNNAYALPHDSVGKSNGTGSDTTVAWNPHTHGFGSADAASNPGADIILGHELVHATHNANGTAGNGPFVSNNPGVNIPEERNTVGLPASTYNNPSDPTDPLNGTALPDTTGSAYNENAFRRDYANQGIVANPNTGVPPVQRPSYFPPTPSGGPGSPI